MQLRVVLPALAGGILALAPAPAGAAPYRCEASALRVTLAGAETVEPLTANRGAAECAAQTAGGALPATPLPLSGGTLFARTTITSGDPLTQVASASAGLASLTVATPPALVPAPDLSALPGGGVIDTPIGTVDLRPALNALAAPAGPLLAVSGVSAEVSARCRGGAPALTADSRIGSLSVLGVSLATTRTTERRIDTNSIDPSDIDIGKVIAPTADLSLLQSTLQPILDTLPNVEVPPIAIRVRATPGAQARSGERVVRRALQLEIEAGGTTVLEAVIGEAVVDATGARCGSLAAAALGCTTRRVALFDVTQVGDRVRLRGAADPRRFAGRRAQIVSRWDGKVAARPRVSRDGLFTVRLPVPPRAIRHTNRARYQARIGRERSLDLKLERRMLVTAVRQAQGRRVTLRGRLVRPLAEPAQEISVTRRVACGSVRVVARFKPDAQGRFSVTLKGPRVDRVYTFRFRSKVRNAYGLERLQRTYTLPQYVVGR
jgi:hypothetical protein